MTQGTGDGCGVAFQHGVAGEGQRNFVTSIRSAWSARVTRGARLVGDLQYHRIAFDQVFKDLFACALLGDAGDSNARSTAAHIDVVRQVGGLRSADLACRDVDHLAVAQSDGQTTVLTQVGTGRTGQGDGVGHRLPFHCRVRRNAQLGLHGVDGIGDREGRSGAGVQVFEVVVARIRHADGLGFAVLEDVIALRHERCGGRSGGVLGEGQGLTVAQGDGEGLARWVAQGTGNSGLPPFLHGIAGQGQRHCIAAIRCARGARIAGGARLVGDLQSHRVAFDQILEDLFARALLGDPVDGDARGTAAHIDVVRQVSGLRSADLARRDVDHLAVAQSDGQTTVLTQVGTGRTGQGDGVGHRLPFHCRVRRNAQLGLHGVDGIGDREGRSGAGVQVFEVVVARIRHADGLGFAVLEHVIALRHERCGGRGGGVLGEAQGLAVAQGDGEGLARWVTQGTGDGCGVAFQHGVAGEGQRNFVTSIRSAWSARVTRGARLVGDLQYHRIAFDQVFKDLFACALLGDAGDSNARSTAAHIDVVRQVGGLRSADLACRDVDHLAVAQRDGQTTVLTQVGTGRTGQGDGVGHRLAFHCRVRRDAQLGLHSVDGIAHGDGRGSAGVQVFEVVVARIRHADGLGFAVLEHVIALRHERCGGRGGSVLSEDQGLAVAQGDGEGLARWVAQGAGNSGLPPFLHGIARQGQRHCIAAIRCARGARIAGGARLVGDLQGHRVAFDQVFKDLFARALLGDPGDGDAWGTVADIDVVRQNTRLRATDLPGCDVDHLTVAQLDIQAAVLGQVGAGRAGQGDGVSHCLAFHRRVRRNAQLGLHGVDGVAHGNRRGGAGVQVFEVVATGIGHDDGLGFAVLEHVIALRHERCGGRGMRALRKGQGLAVAQGYGERWACRVAQGTGDGRGVAFLHGVARQGQRHFIAAIRCAWSARVAGGARLVGDLQGHRVAFDQVFKDLLARALLGDPGDGDAWGTVADIDVVRQDARLRATDLARRDVDHLAVAQGDGQTTVLTQVGTGRTGQGDGVGHRLAFHCRVRRNAQLGLHGVDGIGDREGRGGAGVQVFEVVVARICHADGLGFAILEHVIALRHKRCGGRDGGVLGKAQGLAVAQGDGEGLAGRVA